MPSVQTPHIRELQSVRGIAAAAVMVGHALVYYETPNWFHLLASTFNGRAAVVVFFVLSGHVLTRSLCNALFDRDTILRFYIQRFFRIYPAIWAASAVGLLYIFRLHWQVPVAHPGPLILNAFRADRFDALHIVASLAGMTTFILPQLWSIFIELIASIAIPGIAYVTLQRRQWFPLMLATAVLISFAVHNSYYHIALYFMDFVIGAGLAMSGVTTVFKNAPARPLVAGAFVLLALTQVLPLPYYSPIAHLLETILAATLIGMLIGAKERVAVLQSRFLLFMGDISYSIYLFHFVMLCILAKGFAVAETAAHISMNPMILSVLLAIMTCALTIPTAWMSFMFIEKPGIELGKRVWSAASTAVGRGARQGTFGGIAAKTAEATAQAVDLTPTIREI